MEGVLGALGLSEEDEMKFLMEQQSILEELNKNKSENVNNNKKVKFNEIFDYDDDVELVGKPDKKKKEVHNDDYFDFDEDANEAYYKSLIYDEPKSTNVTDFYNKPAENHIKESNAKIDSISNKNHDSAVSMDIDQNTDNSDDYYYAQILSAWPDTETLIEMPDGSIGIGISLTTLPLKFIHGLLSNVNSQNSKNIYEFLMNNSTLILLLSTLSALSHHEPKEILPYFDKSYDDSKVSNKNDNTSKRKVYHFDRFGREANCWNKGVGFGSGSNNQEWNPKISQERKQAEETYSINIIKILSAFIQKLGNQITDIAFEIIETSCLFNMLASNLRNDSIMDISNHLKLYNALFDLLQNVAYVKIFEKMIKDYQTTTLIVNMRNLVEKYEKLKNMQARSTAVNDDNIKELASMLNITFEILEQTVRSNEKDKDKAENIKDNLEEKYINKMKTYQFDSYDLEKTISNKLLQTPITFENQPRSKRLALELATLSTSLPLSFSSSVFLRCDTNRLDIMKALIIGPEGTPYENGCFEFDILFPQDFPVKPPNVEFRTTGQGKIRFNPNLYNCGKVCLSILNTWPGRPEEQWNEQTSSILQVLVSIQSLILVPEPYFNEPGHQYSVRKKESIEYNEVIREGTIKWAMLEQINNPSPCFKDVILSHFNLKRDQIRTQCENWCQERKNNGSHGGANLQNYADQLKVALNKLKSIN